VRAAARTSEIFFDGKTSVVVSSHYNPPLDVAVRNSQKLPGFSPCKRGIFATLGGHIFRPISLFCLCFFANETATPGLTSQDWAQQTQALVASIEGPSQR
jgi:hypothetical protein